MRMGYLIVFLFFKILIFTKSDAAPSVREGDVSVRFPQFVIQHPMPDSVTGTDDTSQATRQTVLTLQNGLFYLDGKQFAEISFNKFDLLWSLYDLLESGKVSVLDDTHPTVARQIHALRVLRESGFRTIRFFGLPWNHRGPQVFRDPQHRKLLFLALDKVCEIANRAEIGLVWSLGAGSFWDHDLKNGAWVYGEEQMPELFGDSESRSRKACYEYIDAIVTRYRDNRAVVMWEIDNELTLHADIGGPSGIRNGMRCPTLAQVANFWNDVAKRIKENDPLRLVNSGGSEMRSPSQWNLYINRDFRVDSDSEQLKAFNLLYQSSSVDVVDIHSYHNNRLPDFHPAMQAEWDGRRWYWGDYVKAARALGKPVMVGEFWCLPIEGDKLNQEMAWTPDYVLPGMHYTDHPNTLLWVGRTLDRIIESGVQLAYVWCYSSDRPVDAKEGRFTKENAPALFNLVVEANLRLIRNL